VLPRLGREDDGSARFLDGYDALVERAEPDPLDSAAGRRDPFVDPAGGVRRRHDDGIGRIRRRDVVFGDDGEHRILVDDVAVAVDHDDPVAVAVVTDAEVAVAVGDESAEVSQALRRRLRFPAGEVAVDVGVERGDVGPEFAKDAWDCETRCSVSAVDGDSESRTVPGDVAGVLDDVGAIPCQHVEHPLGSPLVPRNGDRPRLRIEPRFDPAFGLAVVLGSVDEQLQPVVVRWVVARGDHDAPATAARVRERRRRNFADAEDVCTAAFEPRFDGGGDPVAGLATVAADSELRAVAGGRPPDGQRE
jgi:hypothetical protein